MADTLHRLHAADLEVADIEMMLAAKEWPPRIAQRVHMSTSGLAKALYRNNRPDLAHIFDAFVRDEQRRRR